MGVHMTLKDLLSSSANAILLRLASVTDGIKTHTSGKTE
jgi:hypothetical protein